MITKLNLICCRRTKGKKCGQPLQFIGRSSAGDQLIFKCPLGHEKKYWVKWFQQRFGFSDSIGNSLKLPDKCPVCGAPRTSLDSSVPMESVSCSNCGATLVEDESGKLVELN